MKPLRNTNASRPALNRNVRSASRQYVSTMPTRRTASAKRSSTQTKPDEVKVKSEKVKQEKIRNAPRTQTSESERELSEQLEDQANEDKEEDEEEVGLQNVEQDDDENEDGSPRSNKRRRVNDRGESIVDDTGSPSAPQIKTLPRGEDGYIPGSIVRIRLCNFVTYDYVEFTPGPYLNMIVGPNGTGKSSIACAIAIGLNFSPTLLGRATELNLFVKNGTDSGYIEIELKGKGKSNLVVRRNLKASSRGSTFSLNGQHTTGTEIKKKMQELNVQVGNLCTFLPQDRVTEFARMSSQQLLRETQHAAGNENLIMWHNTLISSGKDLTTLQESIESEERNLNQMKERNNGIERDVLRYMERKKIEHNIALLNVLVPVAQYREIRNQFIETKARQRQLHGKVKRLQQKNGPAHGLLKEFEQRYKDMEKERDGLKKSTQQKFQRLTAKNQASDKLDSESSDIVDKLSTLKKEEKDRAKQIVSLEKEIEKLQTELEKPPPQDLANEEQLRDETKQLNLERGSLALRIEDFNSEMTECVNQKAAAKAEFDFAERRLKELDNVDIQRLQAMERWDKDTHDAIVWVRNNRNLFKMEVFETPFMRLSVKDRKYANAVEACFSVGQLKTFIAQCKEDVDTLNHNINDAVALGRRAQITTWFRPYTYEELIPQPLSPEEMHQQHFDGYAIDYVDCPDQMKFFLMRDLNLHRVPISFTGQGVDVNVVMSLVARPIPNFNHPGGANFISGRTVNVVTRSRYGRKAISNMTKDVREARNLSAPNIDPEVKNGIKKAIEDCQTKMELCDEKRGEVKQKYSDIDAETVRCKEWEAQIKKKKQAIQEEEKRKISASTRLVSRRKTLKDLKAKPSADKQRADLRAKLLAYNHKRIEFAQQYTDLVHSIIHEQQECTRVGLRYLQTSANTMSLQELCEKKDVRYQNALREYTKANDHFQQVKVQSKEILAESRRVLNEASPDVREEYNEIEEVRLRYEIEEKEAKERGLDAPDGSAVDFRTVDELKAELATQQAKLDLTMNTNQQIVDEYESRKRDIEGVEKTLANRRAKEQKIQNDINDARENWLPALKRLVNSIGSKFSAAFDRIGCAGEIQINENNDYEKWAIDILVKFRDSEKLQLLTAHRQSGGERSLTTILYLMSLTEEARAPFSLVDEINQGMDHRAERIVHNSMVNVTCKPDSAQYFLITPKLLPDLEYHERMRILCVNNGEWLPEERNLNGKMMGMIDNYVKHHRSS